MPLSEKILSVSYGIYSCELQGFDNPISELRSVTKYFCDVAAEDRLFGAEPLDATHIVHADVIPAKALSDVSSISSESSGQLPGENNQISKPNDTGYASSGSALNVKNVGSVEGFSKPVLAGATLDNVIIPPKNGRQIAGASAYALMRTVLVP